MWFFRESIRFLSILFDCPYLFTKEVQLVTFWTASLYFSSMTGRKHKRIQRRCHETAAKAPAVPLSVQLYDQQPTVKLVLIFLNTFDLESCLLCYTIFFSLISTHDTGAQSILAEMYVCGKRISFRTKCIHAQNCIYTLLKSEKEPVTVQMKTETGT